METFAKSKTETELPGKKFYLVVQPYFGAKSIFIRFNRRFYINVFYDVWLLELIKHQKCLMMVGKW